MSSSSRLYASEDQIPPSATDFNRTKIWADLEAMIEAGTVRIPQVTATTIEYLGADGERTAKLVLNYTSSLAANPSAE